MIDNGDWGLGIGDWGLGIGPNPQTPIPNPQSPIPNPQSPWKKINLFLINFYFCIYHNIFFIHSNSYLINLLAKYLIPASIPVLFSSS